jgi:Fic family protein
MKKPQQPPDQAKLVKGQIEWLSKNLAEAAKAPLFKDRYVHWDKLRRLKPPAGVTSEQWWLLVKLSRWGGRTLPLTDAAGKPFSYNLPDVALQYLHQVDQKAGAQLALEEQGVATPVQRDRYLVRSLTEEAISSSQLEGAATTRVVAKQMIRSGRPAHDRGEKMILNNYRAMEWIRGLGNRELDESLLLELQAKLTEDTLDDPSAVGLFRRGDEDVRVLDSYDEVLHTPPPFEQLHDRMARMYDFANGKTPSFYVPPVVRAIILHFWLAYDHPFVDGNGRCARALFYWAMLRQGAWLCEFISVSELIRKAPARYGRAFLYVETDANDLTYFLLYHLELLVRAFESLEAYVRRKTAEIRDVESLLRASSNLNPRQLALLGHALRHPDMSYTVRSHQASHRITTQTARTDLQRLVEMNLLTVRKSGKAALYEPASKLSDRLRIAR